MRRASAGHLRSATVRARWPRPRAPPPPPGRDRRTAGRARRAAGPAPRGTPPRRSRLLPHSRLLELHDRPNLDLAAVLRSRAAGGPVQRGVEVGHVEQVVAAEDLAGLGERAVGDDALAVVADLDR